VTITIKVTDDESWTLRIKRIHSIQRCNHAVHVSYGSTVLHWNFSCPAEAKYAEGLLIKAIDPKPEAYIWASTRVQHVDHWSFADNAWRHFAGQPIYRGEVFSLAPGDQQLEPLTESQIASLPCVSALPTS
jgi:hypothetical protein